MNLLRSFYSALLVVIGSIHVSFSFDDDIQVRIIIFVVKHSLNVNYLILVVQNYIRILCFSGPMDRKLLHIRQ